MKTSSLERAGLLKSDKSAIFSRMTIWVISDGKPGHLNQSLGLVNALSRRVPTDVYRIDINGLNFWKAWRAAISQDLPAPDVVLGAGHKTHIPVLLATRKYKALSFLCMRPSLPMSFYDLCMVPYHDLISSSDDMIERFHQLQEEPSCVPSYVFPTMGAIHRIVPHPEETKEFVLVLVGGPSKYFSWNTPRLIKQLKRVRAKTEGRIVLTTSRRTPKNVIARLVEEIEGIEIFPVEKTDSDWVPDHLKKAKAVWVTEDSVSMIFESIGSGVFVGLLDVPKKPVGTPRVAAGIQLLLSEGYVTPFAQWSRGKVSSVKTQELREADRAADFILKKYPQLEKPADD